MPGLRIALFVEGSEAPPTPRGLPVLERIWQEDLGQSLDLLPFDRIFPISKTHLTAMDPSNPPMSGAGEALDQLMARKLERNPFDVAVVAWDLFPAWNPEGPYCRWIETLDLYRFLVDSEHLPRIWKEQASQRYEELRRRPNPSIRQNLPPLRPGMVFAVCMEPVFEGLLTQDEAAVKRALGISRTVRDWPRTGWGDPNVQRPDLKVLAPAVNSLFRIHPKPALLRRIRGGMETHKAEWGELLLRNMLADDQIRPRILSHPLCRRLAELVGRSRAVG